MTVVQWTADDLWNLLSLSLAENYYIYSRAFGSNKLSLKRTRNAKIKKLKAGTLTMPPRKESYPGKDAEVARAQERQAKLTEPVGRITSEYVQIVVPVEHQTYHEQLEEALEEHGALNGARFSEYQMLTKDNDGEAQVHDLKAKKFNVKFDVEPQWELLKQANPKIVRPAKYERKLRPDGKKMAIILPDPQIGYRRYEDGVLDPTHDERAIEVALQIVADLKPDITLCLGDLMDLPEMSMKYISGPEFNQTMNPSIERAGDFLATIRASVPDTRLVVMEGNHDRRIITANTTNLQANLRLKQYRGNGLPVLSVPNLVNFPSEAIRAEYHSGYPANTFQLTSRLQVIHGSKSVARGSTAAAVISDERVSTIFGHIHRQEEHMKTFHTQDGPKITGAFSPGCLCRIDGAVPSTKGSTDLEGKPILRWENWQHGIAVVEFDEQTGQFHYQNILINTADGYEARYNGKTYRPHAV